MLIASLFNAKAKLWISGRKNLLKELGKEISSSDKIAWFHCASLGEFEQGRPVVEAFREQHKDYKILLTFFSPSGYEIRKNYDKADYVYYLPIDTTKNAKQFMDIVNPVVVFFVKYEFWQCFIGEIGNRKIPLYLVSGIFRKDHRFFKWYGGRARKILRNFTHFFVQNTESKNLLESINLENVVVAGDTRFDRVKTISEAAKNLPLIETLKNGKTTLVAGSTWKPDEEIIVKYLNSTNYDFKLIIAPHEIHKENIDRIERLFNQISVLKYSEANESNIEEHNVLLIDNIGLLSSLYRYADVAYIGGGFGKGIHNTLEAATFGLPVIFGPNYERFQEAVDLKKLGGAFSISNQNDLNIVLDNLLENEQSISNAGSVSAKYVNDKKGATSEIIKLIDTRLF
jgi:3-deoxy-D-manno-octulosonic-acid transferase